MYKTVVYTLVNGVITHQNSKYKKGDIAKQYIEHLGNVVLRNITFFYICCFLMCNGAVN